LTDHEWPGLASKLSHLESAQSNSVQTKGKFTCYYCKADCYIKPNCPKLQAGVPKTDDKQKERRPLAAWKTVRPKDLRKVFIDENKVEWNFCTKCIDLTTKKKDIWSRTHSDAEHKTSSRTTPKDAVKTVDTEKAEANLNLIETDVPIGPPLATTHEPSLEVDPNELVFTSSVWCCPIPLVLPSHTSVTHVHCPIDCQDEDIPILGTRREDDSSDDDSSDDELSSDDEESVALDKGSVEIYFLPLYDNEPIINKTKENKEHKMGKEQEDAHKIWNVVTCLVTLMLAGIVCTTAGIQWNFGTMKNALVRDLFEPIWSIIVLPLFFMSTAVWDFARFLVGLSDLQESVTKRKEISRRLQLKQTRAKQRRTTWLPLLFFFIITWGIMKGYVMVHKSFYQGQIPGYPFSLVNQQLAGNYTRIEALYRFVVLSPGVLLQYQKVQAQKLWLEMRPKQEKSNECEKQEEIDRHFDEFFDT
jgi:hypothetical protein